MTFFLFVNVCIIQIYHITETSKIQLFKEDVTDAYGLLLSQTPAQNLLDEQIISGDPLNDPTNAGTCHTAYLPTDNNDWYPINNPNQPGPSAFINLRATYNITNIAFFINYNNDFSITISFTENNPFDTIIYQQTYNIDSSWGNNKWNILNFTPSQIISPIQFITISYNNSPQYAVLETVIYGIPTISGTQSPETFPNPAQQSGAIDIGLLMGTNAFGWTPDHSDLSNIVGSVREYQEWVFTEGGQDQSYTGYPNNYNRFQCSAQGDFCLDDQYMYAVNNNLNWHQCIMKTPGWVHNWDSNRDQWKPIENSIYFNKDATITPANYIMFADHMFQSAARYGRNSVMDSLLKLSPNKSPWDNTPQPRLTGSNLIQWIEILNEPNCWWTNRQEWYSAVEVSAVQSAAYDGHCSTMPTTVGIKNADNTMKVSTGGLANDSTIIDRWETMYWWSKQYRSVSGCYQQFPAEALNAHFYAQNEGLTQGISPEAFNVYENIKKLSDWRDRRVPDVELWITEYGYDTNSNSIQGAPSIGQWSSFQVQGMWIMRTILAMAATGVQRAHQYMWADVGDQSSWGTYATSGLVDVNYTPKVSYYYFSTMYRLLNGTNFVDRNCELDMAVCTQTFRYINTPSKMIYVTWCPSSNDQNVPSYNLKTNATNATSAVLVTPIEYNTNGQHTALIGVNGEFTINVSELPVFVIVTNSIFTHPTSNPTQGHISSTNVPTPTTSLYIFVDEKMTANEAEIFCNTQYGSSLASIHSESDNIIAATLCVPQSTDYRKGCTIGLNDKLSESNNDGTSYGWIWNDGSSFDYYNWKTNEPNNWYEFPQGEDCVLIWPHNYVPSIDAGTWNDIPCNGHGNYTQRFLCNYGLKTTSNPITNTPTTSVSSTTNILTTNVPTTNIPTTNILTTNIPTTNVPTNMDISSTITSSQDLFPTSNPTISNTDVMQTMSTFDKNYNGKNKMSSQNSGEIVALYILVIIMGICIFVMAIIFIFYKKRKDEEIEQLKGHNMTNMTQLNTIPMDIAIEKDDDSDQSLFDTKNTAET
eukprot:321769_1